MSQQSERKPANAAGASTTTTTTAQRAPHKPAAGRRARAKRAAAQQRLRRLAGLGTAAIIAIIIGAALYFGSPAGTDAGALTNPNAFNPARRLLAVGSLAPDFELPQTDGQTVRLSSLRGQPVLLEFFAIWCPHCQTEVATLNQITAKYAASGLKTFGILASPFGRDYAASRGQARKSATQADLDWFEATFKTTYPSLIDADFSTVNAYGAGSYPTIYIVDREGIIRFAQSGEVPLQTLEAALAQLQ